MAAATGPTCSAPPGSGCAAAADADRGETALDEPGERPLTTWQTITSVLAAGFGVQSERNRERDFARGSAARFVVAGLVGTLLFVLTIVAVVTLVLRYAR